MRNNYRKITDADLAFLRNVVGSARIFTGEEISADYAHDEMKEYGLHLPEVVLEVESVEEVARILEYAHDNLIPVTPRGAGTGLCGGAVALYGGILLSLSKMNKILEIDRDNLMARVQPGVLLMDLAAAVENEGLFYPPDPGEKTATLGGNVATNAGGMRAVKYGVTRDYIKGLEVVLASGKIVRTGGKIIKNSSGYSIKDIFVGSEGSLGIVTEITVQLVPLPKETISLLIPFPSLDRCIETVPAILRSHSNPTAIEFMQREVILAAEKYLGKAFPDKTADAYLLLSFDGNSKEEVERAYSPIANLCLEQGAIDVLISDTPERQESIWQARDAFLEAIASSTTGMDECDVVVPRNRIAEFVKYAHGLEQEHGLRIRSFGHAGDGNIHVYILKDETPETVWQQRVGLIMSSLYEKAAELEGQLSGEHGVGHAKTDYLSEFLGNPAMEVMTGIKRALDPQNILNPGKVVGL